MGGLPGWQPEQEGYSGRPRSHCWRRFLRCAVLLWQSWRPMARCGQPHSVPHSGVGRFCTLCRAGGTKTGSEVHPTELSRLGNGRRTVDRAGQQHATSGVDGNTDKRRQKNRDTFTLPSTQGNGMARLQGPHGSGLPHPIGQHQTPFATTYGKRHAPTAMA